MPCKQCISGTIHAGEPKGTIETIHGLETYVIGNRINPRGIIVMYSDVFGIPLPNNRLIADAYAASGEWLVYLPDFFKGDPVQLKLADILIPADTSKQSTLGKYTGLLAQMPSFIMWMTRHKTEPTSKDCNDFLAALRRATPKNQKIGIVGFCWGGKYAPRAGLEQNMIDMDGKKVPLVDAVVALHPSHLSTQEDVENLAVPTSFGWGLEDSNTPIKQKGEVEATHEKAKKAGRKLPEVVHQVYKPGRHGFAVRGNPDHPQERKCLEDSEKQVLEWFDKWL
ncbi:alpha/beta-hydrolase [Lophiostoma macrostomum CBS 122681]|uniref:Alpha/beta-hydrolase n=1 Tax=Lophiostoma macrostomum CBS 122681 TaxID=1314788 RepID=A0A6A6TQV4_9PLEO|nr:alpha/beta-hydrolase [Lophiostoma macrostomum CBS 122681]